MSTRTSGREGQSAAAGWLRPTAQSLRTDAPARGAVVLSIELPQPQFADRAVRGLLDQVLCFATAFTGAPRSADFAVRRCGAAWTMSARLPDELLPAVLSQLRSRLELLAEDEALSLALAVGLAADPLYRWSLPSLDSGDLLARTSAALRQALQRARLVVVTTSGQATFAGWGPTTALPTPRPAQLPRSCRVLLLDDPAAHRLKRVDLITALPPGFDADLLAGLVAARCEDWGLTSAASHHPVARVHRFRRGTLIRGEAAVAGAGLPATLNALHRLTRAGRILPGSATLHRARERLLGQRLAAHRDPCRLGEQYLEATADGSPWPGRVEFQTRLHQAGGPELRLAGEALRNSELHLVLRGVSLAAWQELGAQLPGELARAPVAEAAVADSSPRYGWLVEAADRTLFSRSS